MSNPDLKTSRSLGILAAAFIAMGTLLVFVADQTATVTGAKRADGNVVLDVTREHFGGHVKFYDHMEHVTKAEVETHSSSGRHRSQVSAVILTSGHVKKPLFFGGDSTGRVQKRDIADKINQYLQDPEQNSFFGVFRLRSPGYWIGLVFAGVGVLILILWIGALINPFQK